MKKFLIALCLLPSILLGQNIKFDSLDYKSLGVYDKWEHSPFRSGKLKGNWKIVDNPDTINNKSKKVLAFQRSRFASNIFGARIDLKNPLPLDPSGKMVHVLINRPMEGRVMLVGLGKRKDRPGQSPDVEQFWIKSISPVPAGQWADAIFPIKSANGVDIYSFVVVPHAESTHNMTEDAVIYISDIEVNQSDNPRIILQDEDVSLSKESQGQQTIDYVYVTEANRNGMITAVNGAILNNYKVPFGKPLTVKIIPAPGFTYTGFIINCGNKKKKTVKKKDCGEDNTFTIPGEWIDGNITLEGLFVSNNK